MFNPESLFSATMVIMISPVHHDVTQNVKCFHLCYIRVSEIYILEYNGYNISVVYLNFSDFLNRLLPLFGSCSLGFRTRTRKYDNFHITLKPVE